MDKFILTKEQVQELIYENRYPVISNRRFLSRCIDGRYRNSKDLPPLAFPGADVGELALIFATANNYGFEVDAEKAYQSLLDIIGGAQNFQLHSDHHGDKKLPASGCGHWKQINLDPAAYNLEKNQLDFIAGKLEALKKTGAKEEILEGEHMEGAVLQVEGGDSVMPRFVVETGEGRMETEVFVYQATLVNERHCRLAEKLIANNAVELYPGTDAEYLYEAFEDVSENHLFETVKRLAKGLPIYTIKFKEDGTFTVEEMDKIQE